MKVVAPGGVIGMMGGGQLGRMTALAAANLGYRVHVFCPEVNSPASQVSWKTTNAEYSDTAALEAFAKSVDVVTFEFENVPSSAVEALAKHVDVRPNAKPLYVAQHRLREKRFVNEQGIATAPFAEITSGDDLAKAFASFGGSKAILKTVEMGYDGKGQYVVDANTDMQALWQKSGMKVGILEGFVQFTREISVIVARDIEGRMLCFPPAENRHKNGILDESVVPASISDDTANAAKAAAEKIAEALGVIGLLTIEFFVQPDGGVLVNEMAPRPHNSGHWTQDGCSTSQFEQFVRAVTGLPLAPVGQYADVTMKNLLGRDVEGWKGFVSDGTAKLHLYGKEEPRDGRKMGHVNYIRRHD